MGHSPHGCNGWQFKLGCQASAILKSISFPTTGTRFILPLSWSLGLLVWGRILNWFYHLLTVLPSPYFVGIKDKAVSAQVPVTINFSNFSEYVKDSHVECGKPHLTKHFFSFLNLISCLNSCKKYLLSETGLAVHSEDVQFPLLKEMRVISWDTTSS